MKDIVKEIKKEVGKRMKKRFPLRELPADAEYIIRETLEIIYEKLGGKLEK